MGWASVSQKLGQTLLSVRALVHALVLELRCKEGPSLQALHSSQHLHELFVLCGQTREGESHTPLLVHTNETGGPLGSVQGSGLCKRGQGVAQPATLPGLTGRHR